MGDVVSQSVPGPGCTARMIRANGSERISRSATTVAVTTRSGPCRPVISCRTVSTTCSDSRANTTSRIAALPPVWR